MRSTPSATGVTRSSTSTSPWGREALPPPRGGTSAKFCLPQGEGQVRSSPSPLGEGRGGGQVSGTPPDALWNRARAILPPRNASKPQGARLGAPPPSEHDGGGNEALVLP